MNQQQQYISDTCIVTCVNNDKEVIGEILNFQEKKFISVALNRSMKLNLQWNGMVYEAQQTGLTFTSDGPKITVAKAPRS